ncbi:hypothetical protein ACQPWY_22190 [Pseudonocardia xinjiangensis]|uniref:hypothetical protein n=1 Tax=Pseudonocardia xinjiangensis TaxID=75289 RepID=UPI003D935182
MDLVRTRRRHLPDRPTISAPARARKPSAHRGRGLFAQQPGLGLAGLVLVVPVAVLVAVGAGGPEPSALVLGPLVTFALPAAAMIAFWWEDWPGSSLRPGWSGLLDTGLVIIAAILLAMLGQLVVGHVDLRGLFDPTPGPGHLPTYPATLPLAGAAFAAMLQLTLVCEGWPLRRLGRFTAGVAALVVSWAVALALYVVVVRVEAPPGSGVTAHSGPLSGAEVGAVLVVIGAWQVLLFVAWRGWPFAEWHHRWQRIVAGNVAVLGGGVLTFGVGYGLAGLPTSTITAAAGSFIAAGLVIGMLFEGWIRSRTGLFLAILLLAVALYALFTVLADTLAWTMATPEQWVGHVVLTSIGISVVLHVGIARRWPFGTTDDESQTLERKEAP